MSLVAMAMALFFKAIPKIFGFLAILFVGWLVASLAEKAVAAVLRTIKFNDLTKRSGLADFFNKMGAGTDPAGVLGAVVKGFIRLIALIALIVAFDALGLPAVSDVLRQLLLWLPNVVVALVVLVIGGLLASALGNVVRGAAAKSALGNSELLAKVASELVWAFAIVEAVNQIGIATALVNTLFMAVASAVALGLAFVFGRRETAAEIVRSWSAKDQQNQEKLARAADEAGADISRKAAQ